jgi:hypothetical protein
MAAVRAPLAALSALLSVLSGCGNQSGAASGGSMDGGGTAPDAESTNDGATSGLDVTSSAMVDATPDAAPDAGPLVDASWTGRAPAAPLFVRNPYLNVWSAADSVSGTWPTLWGGEVKGMAGIARIDGTAYLLIGAPSGLSVQAPTLLSKSLTPTKTEYVLGGGGVAVTLDFLSPVELSDLKRQSAPIGYLTMSARATDGNSHAVSLYVDISGEWANGDSTQQVQWARQGVAHSGGTLTVQSITSTQPRVLAEANDYAEWGTAFVAADAPGMTTAIGADVSLRSMTVATGSLDGTIDGNMPRAIDSAWPVLGFAFDLGSVGPTASPPVTLEVGFVREPAVSYQGMAVPPLWASYWTTWESMAADAYDDASNAEARAQALDSRIVGDALAANGAHYAALCTLALRQAFGGTELVGTQNNPWMFLKEISSDGNVSTVDVVYPASPVFLYTNPTYLKLLLEPLLSYAESTTSMGVPLWPQVFAEHDIGASYPNADGHNNGGGENMPVEETANMLLMMAGYAKRAAPADGHAFAMAHYAIAKQWATFLVANGLDPIGANVFTTDDFCQSQPHIANLGLKAVLGVGAMGVLAEVAGNAADLAAFSSQAKSLMAQWVTNAGGGSGQTLFAYSQPGTWGLKYNAFYDRVLKLNLVPSAVLARDAQYYATRALPFGVPLDSRFLDPTTGCAPHASKTDWQLWMAAAVDDPALATTLIDGVYAFATTSPQRVPFSDYYDTQTGHQVGFQARPVQGGIFSLLALQGTSIVGR